MSDFFQFVVGLLELAVIVFMYMLPTFVAQQRRMSNVGGVAIVNILTGWTCIGWLFALVMACSQRHERA